jgi:hypothetical protein
MYLLSAVFSAETERRGYAIEPYCIERIALPSNTALQPTKKPVTHFACAKCAPASFAAELRS